MSREPRTGDSLLFGAIGFVVAIPFLMRVRRRCGNWRVPTGLLVAMAVTFSLSTFVIGPAIVGEGEPSSALETQPARDEPAGHDAHH